MEDNSQKAILGPLIVLFVTVIGGLFIFSFNQNRRAHVQAVPNYDSQTYDVEITNPATRSYRVIGVSFKLHEKIPPPLPVGDIDLKTIVFTRSDYNPQTGAFYKQLHNVEMPASGNLNFRFHIQDAQYRNYRFRGTLTIHYGKRDRPRPLVIQDFDIIVI